jgi:hypothetical protein
MFVSKAGDYMNVLHSRVGSWPDPQLLDYVGKACQRDKHSSLLLISINFGHK